MQSVVLMTGDCDGRGVSGPMKDRLALNCRNPGALDSTWQLSDNPRFEDSQGSSAIWSFV